MHSSNYSQRSSDAARSEQSRLDDAMRRADDLLIESLKTDDRKRKRRLRILFTLGGLAMIATIGYLLIGLSTVGHVAPATTADSDASGQLAREGWQLWQSGEAAKAAEKFEEAVKIAPQNTGAWNGLGWSRFNNGQVDAAETAFKKVIAVEPKHPAALNGLGQLALMRRKYGEAEKYLLKAAPQASAAWYGLARVYLLQGKFAEAKKWAKKVVDSGDADETARQMLAAAEAKKLSDDLRGEIEPPAPTEAKPGEKTAGNDAALGWRLFNQGRGTEAKEAFQRALKANPKDLAAMNGMGWYLLNSGDAMAAKPYFEKTLVGNSKAFGAMNGLARVLQSEGDLDGAVKLWEEMIAQVPGVSAATTGLADAYLQKEQFDKAVPLLEQLVKAQPNDEQLKTRLTAAREKAGK
jgi:Flp pilus assembly protein TadD